VVALATADVALDVVDFVDHVKTPAESGGVSPLLPRRVIAGTGLPLAFQADRLLVAEQEGARY